MTRKKNRHLYSGAAVLLVFLFCGTAPARAGLLPYPSPSEAAAEMRGLAKRHPDRAEVFVAGRSAGGKDILCIRITRGDGEDRPNALIAGAIHGDEYIANRTAMAAAVMLLDTGGPLAERVLDKMDVYVLPLVNPDGYVTTWESSGDLPPKKTRTNDNEVDLNRNFGKPKFRIDLPLGFSGHKDPESDRWVGPGPWSEPEAQAVRELAREHGFFAAVDYHCSGGMIIPMLTDDRLAQRGLRKMTKAYRKAQSDKYIIAMFPWWVPIYQGSMEEGLYREAGALPILIELGKPQDIDSQKRKLNHFWAFNPGESEKIKKVSEDNARAALFALLEAYDYTSGRTEPRPVEVQ
jgi:predicted deacylase